MLVDVQAEVLSNTHLSAGYHVIGLAAPEIAATARPGQFVMVKTRAGLEPLLRRPFSIFEILRDAEGRPAGLTLFAKRIGVGTSQLYAARVGDHLACLGPLGAPFEPVAPPQEAWMVAGGVGLAPFATLAAVLRAQQTPTTLFYGARTATELFCTELFETMGVRLVVATEDGSRGAHGFITEPLADALRSREARTPVQIYACGPTPMMRRVGELAALYERPCAVSLEQVMGCGIGGCYSCVVRVQRAGQAPHFVRSCLAGPVFNAATIVWEELVH